MEWIIGFFILVAFVGWLIGDKEESVEPPLLIGPGSEYSDWRAKWSRDVNTNKWISKGKAKDIIRRFPPFVNGSENIEHISKRSRFEMALQEEFDEANADFNRKQKGRLSDFFLSVEKNPLTDEQKDCCICMDSAVQIVAAAGSGKTSTIVARVGYALKEGLASPGEILILAFNRSVKEEIESRIRERLGDFPDIQNIKVNTFHAFGLEVIGKSTGKKPRSSDWIEPGRDIQAISDIVEDLRKRDSRFRHDWDFFRIVYGRGIDESQTDIKSRDNIQTINGEWVKSQEEKWICDFLFYNGVEYKYEPKYEYDTASEEHSQYKPDFYYPDIKLYHEHFALDEHGNAPDHFKGNYVSGVHWKRALHKEKKTRLFETTSHGLRSGNDFVRLKSELEKHGLILKYDESRKVDGKKPVSVMQLASTIRAFQQHVKSNELSHEDLDHTISVLEYGHHDRLKRFVELYEKIADEWQRRLHAEDCIDFDDMLLDAIKHLKEGAYESPYSMVLADEFQDVSQARLRLLKALKDSAGPSTNLCVVGDDWQGINRFAGADISVMTGFERTFSNATQLMLSKTFRCPRILCEASSEFIQKNPRQIRKTVETKNTHEGGLYAFAAVDENAVMRRIEQDLQKLCSAVKRNEINPTDGSKVSVMLLGRYNKDKPTDLNRWKRSYGAQLDLGFSTVHGAKGLEADYVMILNVIDSWIGFPSRIADDPVLQIAMPEPDEFPMAEERRLFYVALTRARRETRIYTLQKKPSMFVVELANDGHTDIETENTTLEICPECETGILGVKNGRYGSFIGCNAYPRCKYTRNISSSSVKPVRLK